MKIRRGRGPQAPTGRPHALFDNRNTCSFGREHRGEFGVLMDICERTKTGVGEKLAKAVGHDPSLWPGGASCLKT